MPRKPRAEALDPKAQAARVVRALVKLYPDPKCALVHENAYQLLVATILSAQCTDARVNMVTPALFERYPNAKKLAHAEPSEIETLIRSTGFFRAKAKNLLAMSKQVTENHDGEIPKELDALTKLPGVGRKTAHVVLGTGFSISSGVVVDTHVKRLAHRLGLTRARDPKNIERDLMDIVPRKHWINFSHRLIDHGRKVCIARKPRCSICTLAKICPKIGVPGA